MIFLLFVLVASAVGIGVVLLRNRRPTSMEASISEFERTLGALAPEVRAARPRPPRADDVGEVPPDTGARDPG